MTDFKPDTTFLNSLAMFSEFIGKVNLECLDPHWLDIHVPDTVYLPAFKDDVESYSALADAHRVAAEYGIPIPNGDKYASHPYLPADVINYHLVILEMLKSIAFNPGPGFAVALTALLVCYTHWPRVNPDGVVVGVYDKADHQPLIRYHKLGRMMGIGNLLLSHIYILPANFGDLITGEIDGISKATLDGLPSPITVVGEYGGIAFFKAWLTDCESIYYYCSKEAFLKNVVMEEAPVIV